MTVQDLGLSLDTVWMLLAAMLVFFMQPGFALVEAGFTRSKNTANILMKYGEHSFQEFRGFHVWFAPILVYWFRIHVRKQW